MMNVLTYILTFMAGALSGIFLLIMVSVYGDNDNE